MQTIITPDGGAACGGTFTAVADASLSEISPDTNFGLEERLTVSNTSGDWQTVLAFDIASLPERITIHHAYLLLDVAESGHQRADTFLVHNVTEAWEETAVTWNTPPAYRLNRLYANKTYADPTLQIDVTPLVQTWLSTAETNRSLFIRPRTDDVDINFYSREHQEPGVSGPRLVIRCALAETEQWGNSAPADTTQLNGLNRLHQESLELPEVRIERGAVQSALFVLPVVGGHGRSAIENARWFLAEYQDLLRVPDADQVFQFTRLSPDQQMVFFRQRHNGIPVYGAEVSVHINQDEARYFGGSYIPAIRADATPRLNQATAETIAAELIGLEAIIVGDTQLYYFNPGLLGFDDHHTYLTWLVNVEENGRPAGLFIDADTGSLLYQQARETDGFDLQIRDAHGLPDSIGCWGLFFQDTPLWGTEDGVFPYVPDPEAFTAFTHIQAIHNHWWQQYGYDSFDDDGGELYMFLNVGMSNAISSGGGCIRFGNDWATRDIIGHEFTHEVDKENADLEYVFLSGALDESFADIFGHFVDPADWWIGEGSSANTCGSYPTGTFRDMANPPGCSDPDKMSDLCISDAQCDWSGDNGGVHTNSGIHNKAAYLVTDGGTFNGYTMDGIGPAKARWLYYFLLTQGVVSTSDFHHTAVLALLYSNLWANTGVMGFTANDVCQIRNAYAATEILAYGDENCDGVPDQGDGDTDGDGEDDNLDNCVDVPNTGQQNNDGDEQGDACDDNDDNDGYPDSSDNCQFVFSTNQFDWDDDDIGDVCDDSDGDKAMDAADNCQTTANNDQANFDGDYFGDACDLDKDDDGVLDIGVPSDNCPYAANTQQEDGDLDHIGDACDLCPDFPSPDNNDNDGDGLGDPCDPNDDNDTVPDSRDNCDFVDNESQADIDHNGIGYACDPEEQETQENVILQQVFIPAELPLPLEIPICPACGGLNLPLDHPVSVQTTLSAPVYARVLNSQGHIMAQGVSEANSSLALDFTAAPFSQLVGGGNMSYAPTRELPADQVNYTLEIFPLADPGGNRTFDLSVVINQGHKIYMPVIVR